MHGVVIRTAIVAAWLAAMAWFVRYEAFPGWFTGALSGYRGLLREGEVFSDSYLRILYRGHVIGVSHETIEMDESNPVEQYRLSSQITLRLNLLGEPQPVKVNTDCSLDPLRRLVRFRFFLQAQPYATLIEGTRADGEYFSVRVHSEALRSVARVRIPDDVIIYSPMTMMALSRLKPGESVRVKTLDPASLTTAEIIATAVRHEPYAYHGSNVAATVLSVDYQGLSLLTWLDGQGRVLKQETPFGWTIEACEPDEAVLDARDVGADLLDSMAVPVTGRIADGGREVTLRLSGVPFGLEELNDARQTARTETGGVAVVTLRADAANAPAPLTEAERREALAATTFIQSDHPAMRRQAEALVKGLASDEDKVLAIAHWVNRSLTKNPAVSLPSALDVLERREGDCNEHTYLFVALARAAGLPARVRAGLFYKDGRFYYHAWPTVYAGGWRELDPTLGFDRLGVRHLALVQGELPNQMKLMGLLGRLRAEVLECK